MTRAYKKRVRLPPPPPKVPRVPFFHGDTLADDSVYCAPWDAFLGKLAFVNAVPLAEHLIRYQRRLEWLQRNKRQAGAARPNVLAKLLFGARAEPTNVRDLKDRQPQIMERHAAGQCAACKTPIRFANAHAWTCVGCVA